MQKKLFGFILILISLLLLIIQTESAPIQSFITWPFLLILLGAILVLVAFVNKNDKLALTGGIAAAIGLFIWGRQNIDHWSDHWSILMIFIGVAILFQFMINKQNISAVVSLILMISGICAWPGLREIASLSSIAPTLNTYWPVLILGLGVYFIARK